MNVLHVVASNQRRGAEVFARDLVSRLDDLDQRVAILRRHDDGLVFDAPTVVLASGDRKSRAPWQAMRALDEIVRTWRPDVIQCHGGETLKLLGPTLMRGRPAVVYRRIGLSPDWMAQGFRIRLHRMLMGRAHAIVAVAQAVAAETAGRFGIPADRITVIPNAVDSARVEPRRGRMETRASVGVPDGVPLVLFAGALNDEKNPLAAVDVACRVIRELPQTVFLVAGEGPERGRLEQRIEASLSDRTMILLGSRTDLPDLMGAADALVCTSRTEGLPGLLIEAGMNGLPVVGFDVGGVSEVVVDGSTGLLAPPGDRDLLATQLVDVLADKEFAVDLGERATARCRGMFDIGPVASRYRSLYEALATDTRWNPDGITSPTYEETISDV